MDRVSSSSDDDDVVIAGEAPGEGEMVLSCSHTGATARLIKLDRPITIRWEGREDVAEASWVIICVECHADHGENLLGAVQVVGTWSKLKLPVSRGDA